MTVGPSSRITALLLLSLGVGACSALVSPDPGRLGDAGAGGVDAGGHGDAGHGDGGGPTCPTSCDDSIACTTDGCDTGTGTCHHLPTDSLCGAGMRCAGTGCVPSGCTSDASCDDGDPCNGTETCAGGTCAHGTAPSCADTADCTADSCVTGTGCVHAPNDAMCDDGVTCTADTCSSSGCAHAPDSAMCNGGCRSGATCSATGCTGGVTMACVADGNPCTADPTMCDASSGTCLHPLHDNDMDGFPNASAMGTTGRVDCTSLGGTDCNDFDPNVHPGATEICNGRDDNCNGMVDEGCTTPTPPDDCATEQAIMLVAGFPPIVSPSTGAVAGDTSSLSDDYNESGSSCMSPSGGTIGGGNDAVYYIDVFGAADIAIDTHGSSFDTVAAAAVGSSACGSWNTHCNDDTTGSDHTSTVPTFCVGSAGVTTRVHILVDGFGGGSSGTFTVHVTVTPRVTGLCG